jgi:hypothetical protein
VVAEVLAGRPPPLDEVVAVDVGVGLLAVTLLELS